MKNYCKYIDLDITFNIPLYSRSLIVPSGQVYLMGGEDATGTVRSEVYRFNALNYEENAKMEMKVGDG